MKRNAVSELNHENWNQEDEKEDRGSFVTADKSVISQRKVIVARRKPAPSASGVFKSFSGFSQISSSTFNLNSNDTTESNKEKHLNALKILNTKFLEAISKHINENPICVLTPLLNDYNNHLSIIKSKYPLSTSSSNEDKHEEKVSETSKVSSSNNSAPVSNTMPTFSFNTGAKFNFGNTQKEEVKTLPVQFNFGTNQKEEIKTLPVVSSIPETTQQSLFNKDTTKSLFGSSFGASNENGKNDFNSLTSVKTEGFGGFNFPSNTAQTNNLFGCSAPTLFNAQNTVKCQDEEEEYIPPTAEVREVKEKDSVYDTKCKLYYQKDKEWKTRGVGNLFIKPISKGKFQLVIRADNSLATIILNILINEMTPMSTKQNNVSLVTITDFDKGSSPTPLLIRVKTPEKAEELLAEMKKQL